MSGPPPGEEYKQELAKFLETCHRTPASYATLGQFTSQYGFCLRCGVKKSWLKLESENKTYSLKPKALCKYLRLREGLGCALNFAT